MDRLKWAADNATDRTEELTPRLLRVAADAMQIKGDQLRPVLRDGNILIIEPDTMPEPGDRVLVHLRDGRRMVLELIAQRDGEFVLDSVVGGNRVTIQADDLHPDSGLQFIGAVMSPTSLRTGSGELRLQDHWDGAAAH